MQFKDIIGQADVKQHLLDMYASHRIPHALLFLGPEGSGAFPLALAFAQYINCTGDKSNGDSCGVCPSCRKFALTSHPDLHFVFPVKKRDDNTTSDTYIAEWREFLARSPYFSLPQWTDCMSGNQQALIPRRESSSIHQKLSMKPYEAHYQVMVMWRPELLNAASANSILKILEEPPANTIFILVAESTAEMLPTVISRTQIIKVPNIADEDVANALVAKYGTQPDLAAKYAHVANGNVITAFNIIEEAEESRAMLDFFVKVMRTCYTRNVQDMISMADVFARGFSREQIKERLAYSQRMIRENFVLNLANPDISFMNPAEEAFSEKFSRFVHLDNVFRMSQLIDDAIAHIEQNGNANIILLDLFFQLTVCLKTPRPQ